MPLPTWFLMPSCALCCKSFVSDMFAWNRRLPPRPGEDAENGEDASDDEGIEIPFKPVTLTFTDVCYDVKASKGKDTLRLLNNANGIFGAGRMLALMGSSGVSSTIRLLEGSA